MRLIYVDEAGTSAREPVRVVASVIVNADEQYRILDEQISSAVAQHVPEALRPGYVVHAKEIFNGGKRVDRTTWPFESRREFLSSLLRIPRENAVPISVGFVFSDVYSSEMPPREDLDLVTLQHSIAFSSCVERADLFLRKYLNGNEVGLVVSEDVPERRRFLSLTGLLHRSQPMFLPAGWQRPNRLEHDLGLKPPDKDLEIRNIIDVPHFVAKGQAPMLQLADVCAFTFRRCLSRQPYGEELVQEMLGDFAARKFLADDVWFSGLSSGLFNTGKYWSEQQIEDMRAKLVAQEIIRIFEP